MKYSAKRPVPPALRAWLGLANADWTPNYGDFQNPEKDTTHKSLLEEQGFVCAYCGRALKADRSDSHIDHFWPQKHFPDRALDYTNMVASCGPPKVKKEDAMSTCGDAKGNWFDPKNVDLFPWLMGCEQRFRYLGGGGVDVVQSQDRLASTIIIKLNLNNAALKEERKRIITALEQDIVEGMITKANKSQEIARW
ncbi:MAG: retron system putative HNH endonuclease, partial [Desulfuromonadaceae bacterium]